MPIETRKEDDAVLAATRVLENCCFCGRATRFWSTKDVPVCPSCAELRVEEDVPSKDVLYGGGWMTPDVGRGIVMERAVLHPEIGAAVADLFDGCSAAEETGPAFARRLVSLLDLYGRSIRPVVDVDPTVASVVGNSRRSRADAA